MPRTAPETVTLRELEVLRAFYKRKKATAAIVAKSLGLASSESEFHSRRVAAIVGDLHRRFYIVKTGSSSSECNDGGRALTEFEITQLGRDAVAVGDIPRSRLGKPTKNEVTNRPVTNTKVTQMKANQTSLVLPKGKPAEVYDSKVVPLTRPDGAATRDRKRDWNKPETLEASRPSQEVPVLADVPEYPNTATVEKTLPIEDALRSIMATTRPTSNEHKLAKILLFQEKRWARLVGTLNSPLSIQDRWAS